MKKNIAGKRIAAMGMAIMMVLSLVGVSGADVHLKAEDKKQIIYQNTKEVTTDTLNLPVEDWGDAKPIITYDESIADISTTENFTMTADVMLDQEAYTSLAEEGDYMKLQGVVKLGDGWTWTDSQVIPYLQQKDFAQTEGTENYQTSIEIPFSEKPEDVLKGIYFVVVAQGFQGKITFSNVTIENIESGSVPLPEADPSVIDDFENAEAQTNGGWVQESGWQYDNSVTISVENAFDSNRLKLGLDYTGCEGYTWSEAKIKKTFPDGIDVSAYNRLTYDVIYPEGFDGFKAKVFAKNGESGTTIIDQEGTMETSDLGNGMKKATVMVKFTPNEETITELIIGTVGVSTNFAGDVYLDEIRVSQHNADADYVDITSVLGEKTAADISAMPESVTLTDKEAGTATKALYSYLKSLEAKDQVLFGHQNDTHKHVGSGQGVYSDTKDITGSISGIVGIDSLALTGVELGIDNVDEAIAKSVEIGKAAAAEGAIITLSTHMPNMSDAKIVATPSEKRAFDFSKCDFSESKNLSNNCAQEVLPGGAYNAQFTTYLDIIADYALALQEEGIPVLFRPFHENTGGWFWWGAATTDVETYKALFRYTKDYLTEKGVHNFIYVYSPNGPLSSVEEYETRYPGDDCVDIVAFDYYDDYNTYPAEWSDSFMTSLKVTCQVVKSFADAHGKVAAISETGVRVMKADGSDNEGILVKNNPIKGHNWYKMVNDIAKETGMPYFLVWANFSDTNFYVPYKYGDKGQELINEFIDFYNESSSVFADGTNFYGNASVKEVANEKTDQPGGYFTNIFSKDVIKADTVLRAKVKNADEVCFVLKNGAAEQCIVAAEKNGFYEGTVTTEMLAALGKTDVGMVSLVADQKTLVTLSFISFDKEKETLAKNVIEDFELYYGDNDYLNGTFTENSAANCSSSFQLDATNKASGSYGGAFTYRLKTNGPEVWTGRMKGLTENDYSEYNAISMWIKPDGMGQKLVIQLVSGGEDFEAHLTDFVGTTEAKYVTIPFSQLKGKQNGTFNAADITKFAVWCNSISKGDTKGVDIESAIVFDDIRFVKVDESTLTLQNGYALSDKALWAEETDKPEDTKPEDTKPEDTKPEDTKPASGNSNTCSNQSQEVTGTVVFSGSASEENYKENGKSMRRFRSTNGTDVSVCGQASVLPEGIQLGVERLGTGNVNYKKAEEAVANLSGVQKFLVYDVNLKDFAGVEIHQMNGYVNVTMPLPDGLDVAASITVYRLEEDGSLTKCATAVKDGYVTFSTNHFSTFVFVQEGVNGAPKTSDANVMRLSLAIMLLLAGTAVVCMAKKKKAFR